MSCSVLILLLVATAPASPEPPNNLPGVNGLAGQPASTGGQKVARLAGNGGPIGAVNLEELGRVSADRDGNLYFAGPGQDGRPASDIYCARRTRRGYAPAERLASAVNTQGREYSPFVASDGSYLVFARQDSALGVDSFFLSFRTEDGHWTEAIYLREYVPTIGHCLSANVTSDGSYLIYTEVTAAGRHTGIVEAGFIEDLRQQVFGRRLEAARVIGRPRDPRAP